MINTTLLESLVTELESEQYTLSSQLASISDHKNKRDLLRRLTCVNNLIKNLLFYKLKYISNLDTCRSIVKKEINKINIKSNLCK